MCVILFVIRVVESFNSQTLNWLLVDSFGFYASASIFWIWWINIAVHLENSAEHSSRHILPGVECILGRDFSSFKINIKNKYIRIF